MKTTAEGDYDRDNDTMRYTLTANPDSTLAESGKWITSGAKSFREVGGAWKEQEYPDVRPLLMSIETVTGPSGAEPKLVGSETVHGQDTNHYTWTGEVNELEGSTYEAWVSKSSGEFVQVSADMKRRDGKKWKYTIVVSKIGEPLDLQAPK